MDTDLQDTQATRSAIAFVVAAGDGCGNNLSGKRYRAGCEEEPRRADRPGQQANRQRGNLFPVSLKSSQCSSPSSLPKPDKFKFHRVATFSKHVSHHEPTVTPNANSTECLSSFYLPGLIQRSKCSNVCLSVSSSCAAFLVLTCKIKAIFPP